MSIYRTADGEIYEVDSTAELVEALRASSHAPGFDQLDYMRRAAQRAWIQSAASVRSDRSDNFVEDLLAGGLLEICE